MWGYGAVSAPGTDPAEARSTTRPSPSRPARPPVRVKWINELVDASGNYLPHLLPVDQTLHWANPPGGPARHRHARRPPYTGPVPIVTHVHGAHTCEESDGYPEAWYLPAANDIPAEYATEGTYYASSGRVRAALGRGWQPGSAIFQYPNDQRDDHALVPRPLASA